MPGKLFYCFAETAEWNMEFRIADTFSDSLARPLAMREHDLRELLRKPEGNDGGPSAGTKPHLLLVLKGKLLGMLWYAWRGSNSRPSVPETDALVHLSYRRTIVILFDLSLKFQFIKTRLRGIVCHFCAVPSALQHTQDCS